MSEAVRALVLIYDIRGFTAAAKRLEAAHLGAFAKGAHRAILDLFGAIPPTFVKNLGDGHLLLWETGPETDPALVEQVVAAARRAQTAFAAFATSHGEAGATLPRHVGVGVAVGEVSKSDDYYGTALNLAARLQNLSRPEGVAVDPTVFAAASARDAAIRQEFRRAQVRLKGLGSTAVWVRRPFSWARALAPVGKVAALLAVPLAWVALADAGLGLPGGDGLRRFLDERGTSWFRAPRPASEVAVVAARARAELSRRLVDTIMPEGWIRGEFARPEKPAFDAWASAQNAYALLRGGGLSLADRRRALAAYDYAFRDGVRIEVGDQPFGWPPHPGFTHTEAEPLLWTAIGISRALADRELVPDAERSRWLERLGWIERAARLHRPLTTGGWNIFPQQQEPDHPSPYTTALALLWLLEAREAGLPIEGSEARRDELLLAAARWFVAHFLPDANPAGWRRTKDPLDVVSSGLTLQIYGLLLRARATGLLEFPAPILDAIPRRLEALVGQGIESAADAGEYNVTFTSHEGRRERRNEAINFLWHPWAIETAVLWLANPPPSASRRDRTVVRRVLGHLVVDLEADALRAVGKGYTFVGAETLMGLSGVGGG